MKPLQTLTADLAPIVVAGFLGALVALAYLPGLSVRQRLTATFAGGVTASAVSWALQDVYQMASPVAGGVSFVVGLLAFSVTPALMRGAAGAAEGLPGYVAGVAGAIADRIRTMGGPK